MNRNSMRRTSGALAAATAAALVLSLTACNNTDDYDCEKQSPTPVAAPMQLGDLGQGRSSGGSGGKSGSSGSVKKGGSKSDASSGGSSGSTTGGGSTKRPKHKDSDCDD